MDMRYPFVALDAGSRPGAPLRPRVPCRPGQVNQETAGLEFQVRTPQHHLRRFRHRPRPRGVYSRPARLAARSSSWGVLQDGGRTAAQGIRSVLLANVYALVAFASPRKAQRLPTRRHVLYLPQGEPLPRLTGLFLHGRVAPAKPRANLLRPTYLIHPPSWLPAHRVGCR